MKARIGDGFGPRLAQIRKGRGISQETLGEVVGVSQRVIAFYEADGAQPPGPMLADLALALRVTTDELLGLAPVREELATRARPGSWRDSAVLPICRRMTSGPSSRSSKRCSINAASITRRN